MNAICLIIDRLAAGYLGCYGNSWIATPALDRLACESVLFDRAYVDAPAMEGLYRSYWLGAHALAHERAANDVPLPKALGETGMSTTLLTDDPTLAGIAGSFEHVVNLAPDPAGRPASDPEETHLAGFFAAAIECLQQVKPPYLLWLHTGALGMAWDAPMELRAKYTEEGDPDPSDSVEVPAMRLSQEADPDFLLGIRQAYAAQVSVLDYCLQGLLDWLDTSPLAEETLLMVLSARGFALGTHEQVGQPPEEPEALYGEVTNVPWLMRFPDRRGVAERCQAFVQPADLPGTLAQWCGIAQPWSTECGRGGSLLPWIDGESEANRDRACVISSGGEYALRTPAWYARFPSPNDAELYTKPDDRWEINEVSTRCPHVAEAMWRAYSDWQRACRQGDMTVPPLDEVLVEGLE